MVDLRLAISRPWPSAILSMGFADFEVSNLVYQHRDARLDGSKDQLRQLTKKWGYRSAGASTWNVLELSVLRAVADAMAGRTEPRKYQFRRNCPPPSWTPRNCRRASPSSQPPRTGPPSPKGAKRARRKP